MTEQPLSFAKLRSTPPKINALLLARVFGIAALVGTMLSLPLTNIFAALALLSWIFTAVNRVKIGKPILEIQPFQALCCF
jgi:hypothetical protein